MLGKIVNWIKNNKLTFVLLLIVAYFAYTQLTSSLSTILPSTKSGGVLNQAFQQEEMRNKAGIGGTDLMGLPSVSYDAPPTTGVADRMVIRESYLSLQVKNVRETQEQIIKTAETFGGYMVDSFMNNPQDAPTSTVTVRIPANRMNEALNNYRNLAVKVVSENLSGQDVTDQFVDNEARLKTYENTKTKFQEIFDQATKIEDILAVQRELINIQTQIDSLKGQQEYLEKNSEMSRLTIYLSTDEFSLPYAPSEAWRPEVIFKQAVRSLVGQFRKLGTALIWLAVYSIIFIPLLLIIRYFLKQNKYR